MNPVVNRYRIDASAANRLAHEVLGRSLDALPLQTRTLLDRIMVIVAESAEATKVAPADIRFSRRNLREETGMSDTQLKLHLSRLVELEYLLAHRVERGQLYELLYDGDGEVTPHLSGLIDPKMLGSFTYDGERSGVKAHRSGSGRGSVGPRSGGGRGASLAANADAATACVESDANGPETLILETSENPASYSNGKSYARASSSLAASSSSAAE